MAKPFVISTGYDQTIRFWNPLTADCFRTIPHPDSQINAMSLSADQNYLAAAGNPTCKIFDINAQVATPIITFTGHKGNVTSIGSSFAFDWLFTCSEDCTIKIWDRKNPSAVKSFKNSSSINKAALHTNQAEIFTVDQAGSLRIWDVIGESCLHELIPEPGTVLSALAVAPNSNLVAVGAYSGYCYLWSTLEPSSKCTELVPLLSFMAHSSYITKISFSADAKILCTCSADKSIRLWNSSNGHMLCEFQGHQKWVWDANFSSDSRLIASASSDSTVCLWDVQRRLLIKSFIGHDKGATTVLLSD